MRFRVWNLILFVALCCAGVVPGQQRPQGPMVPPPVFSRQRSVIPKGVKDGSQEEVPDVISKPQWKKARADSTHLLDLAQQIQRGIQSGPHTIPADLAKQLKELEHLSKQLRRELQL